MTLYGFDDALKKKKDVIDAHCRLSEKKRIDTSSHFSPFSQNKFLSNTSSVQSHLLVTKLKLSTTTRKKET